MEIVNEGGAAHMEARPPLDLLQGTPGQALCTQNGNYGETCSTSDGNSSMLVARSCVTEGEGA